MDTTECSLQDVVRCYICEKSVPHMHCDICHIHLCKPCVGEHLSDESKEHKIVSFAKRGATPKYPKCPQHIFKQCDLHCERCCIPICVLCVFSNEHLGHETVSILNSLEAKKEVVHKDLQELEKIIFPKYQEIASNIPGQKADLEKTIQELTTILNKQREEWHKDIDIIITKLKSNIDQMKSKRLAAITRQENEIKDTISEIEKSIANLKKLLKSNDARIVSEYKSKNAAYRRYPHPLNVSSITYTPPIINKEDIYRQFNSMTTFPSKLHEEGYAIDFPCSLFSSQSRSLINEPRIIQDINTEYGDSNSLINVSCLSSGDIWTCGFENNIRLYSFLGNLKGSIQTKSLNYPSDITITQGKDLIYADYKDRTINKVKNAKIQTVIRLREWKPRSVCSTSYDDLLVVMDSDDCKQTKVVRFSVRSTEKQTIQFNAIGQPIFSPGDMKYIIENRNLDICVTDSGANAVVVVNQDGELRFTYSGFSSTHMGPFNPRGIATDSQSRILTGDYSNRCIHILNQNGQFLHYIQNCDLKHPHGLCIDINDNLFVTESVTGKVKKIKYCM